MDNLQLMKMKMKMALCNTVPYSKENGRRNGKRRFVGWPGNLPDLNLVESNKKDTEVENAS